MMGRSEQSRRDLMRNALVAVPALGIGLLLGNGLASVRNNAEEMHRELDLELEHRYPFWTNGDYSTGVITSTLSNEGNAIERNITWQIQAAGSPGTALVRWTIDEFFELSASSATVETAASPSADFALAAEVTTSSEDPASLESTTMLTVPVSRLDPGMSVRLEATFRGVLTLVLQEAQSTETATTGYLRFWPITPSTPTPA
jgi:hypothetical protein